MVNHLLLLLVVVLVGGCGQDDIKVYSVPKEQPAPITQGNMPAGHPETVPQFRWKTPANWSEQAAGDFRVASFKVMDNNGKEADVSVIPLPGSAGGDLSNVNRWRGQVGQGPVSAEELQNIAQSVEVAGQPAALYEQNGETTRILAAIQHRDGTAWFFKMTGDSQLVAQEKLAFVEFLKSVEFGEVTITAGEPKWDVPADWKESSPGPFLVAKFTITGDGQASVNVSSSAGDGGGLTANVNRWRKQLELEELTGDEVTKSVKTMGPIKFVEMRGPKASLIGAIVFRPEQAWFYKLMGDAPVVAAQQDAFTKFVQGVRY